MASGGDEYGEALDAAKQVQLFSEFIDKFYLADLLEKARKGLKWICIDFRELSKFEPRLADILLDHPDDVLKAAEIAIDQFDLPTKDKKFNVRVSNLPRSRYIKIRNIRSKDLNKMVWTEGVVRQKSEVRPQMASARFECPSCGNVLTVLQVEKKFKEPTRCSCGRKGKFRILSKELLDAQSLTLEESPDDVEGGEQPKRINCLLKKDLVSPLSERKSNPGSKVIIVGQVKEVPIILRQGGQSTRFDLILDGNSLEGMDEEFGDLIITQDEEEQIKTTAADPKLWKKLIPSVCPSIYGHDRIKEALFVQQMGGVRKVRDDGVVTRGDMHIMLIGDPGGGKCVPGDTKIVCGDGSIRTIQNIIEEKQEVSIATVNKTGRITTQKPSRFWKRVSPKTLLQITTETGRRITVTKEHPLFSTQSGIIFAKPAETMRIGDHLATPRHIPHHGTIQSLPKMFTKSRSRNQQSLRFPKKMTKDMARLLGYLIGDGYVAKSATSRWLSYTSKDPELIADYKRLIKKVFNGTTTERSRLGSAEIYITSESLINFLSAVDKGIVQRSAQKSIPQAINTSPLGILKEFIAAFFECEAHINLTKRQIEVLSLSNEIIEDLQCNLLKFGIISCIRNKIKYATNTKSKRKIKAYELVISGEQASHYLEKIGFISAQKQRKGFDLLHSRHLVKSNTNIDIIPHVQESLRLLRSHLKLHQREMGVTRSTYQHYERGDRHPSRKHFNQIISQAKKRDKSNKLVHLLDQLGSTDIFWDKIKKIEEIANPTTHVYDFEVNTNHNFVANNFIIHNSQMLRRMMKIAPKARYVSGKGVSGAGLSAAVVKDEFLQGWSLEAGALVLANKGLLCVDELDKMDREDSSSMHEALEQQTITISKANIQAVLRCETTVVAAANPKFGRFDPYDTVANQINLPSSLINRFDLIFPIRDLPDEKKDGMLADFVLRLHQQQNVDEAEIPTDLLRKYISYGKRLNPKLSEAAVDELRAYYIKMRNIGGDGKKGIAISPRQLEGLVRMTEAYARARLSEKATKKDAQRAVDLLDYCLKQVAYDEETGTFDIDRIATDVPAKQRNKILVVKEILNDLEGKVGKVIPLEDVVAMGVEKGYEEAEIEEVIQKLKRSGDLFEPRRGFISKI